MARTKKAKMVEPGQEHEVPVAADQPVAKEPVNSSIFDKDGELVVDVFENDSHFVVLAAIAGVQIKDLDISIDKDMMVIKGHRPDPHDDATKKYFYQECYWGPFSRKVVLPENIDTEAADAQMDKGMLTIKIPKTAAGKVAKKENIEEV